MQNTCSLESFFNNIKRAAILFVFGSGISIALTGRKLSWKEWLRTGCEYVTETRQDNPTLHDRIETAHSADELADIAEELIATLKQEGAYRQWMQDSFENQKITTPNLADILKKLSDLPSVHFATTNYDLLLEQATGLPPCSGNVSATDRQETNSAVFGGRRAILHLHGYFDSQNSHDDIVASRKQYNELSHNKASQFSQQWLSVSRIMIFVGCGATVEDDNIAPMMTFAQKELGFDGTHYFLHCSQEKQDLPDTVCPIEYGMTHEALPAFLEKIHLELKAGNPSVGKLGNWANGIFNMQGISQTGNEERDRQRKISLQNLKASPQELPHERQSIDIDGFIARKVLISSDTSLQELDFLNWAKDFRDIQCRVKVLEAPAGFGKTGLLEQLYRNLLEEPLLALPPLFISCINPYRSGDIEHYMQDTDSSLLNAFNRYEAYFLIDGFDELDSESQNVLLSDLSRIVSAGATYKTYALISVRQNQLDRSAVRSKIANVQFASIKPLSNEDIREIAIRKKMNEAQVESLMKFISEENHAYNIFFVTTAISYFMQNGVFGSRIKLLDFLLGRDMEMLGRHIHCPIPQVLTAKAMNRILANRDMPEACNAFEGIPANSFNFSHRIIEEYLAAKAIAQLELNQITELITEDGIVIPALKNMTALILMLLSDSACEESQLKYKDLLKMISRDPINLEIIMSTETDTLSREVRENLMEIVVDYYTKDAKYNLPDCLFPFIDANLEQFKRLVFKRLENRVESQPELLHLLYVVSLSHKNCLDNMELISIIDMFFDLAKNSASEHANELDLLSLILRHNSTRIKLFSQMKITMLVNLATSDIVDNAPELFMSICSMLTNSAKRLKVKDYLMILDKYFDLINENVCNAYSVPQQIGDDFNPQSGMMFSQSPFLDISDVFFSHHEKVFITFVQKYCEYLNCNCYDVYSAEISQSMVKWFCRAIAGNKQEDESTMRFLEVCQKQYDKNPMEGVLPLFEEMECDVHWNHMAARIMTTAYRKRKKLDDKFDYLILANLFNKVFTKPSLFNECLALIPQSRAGDFLEFSYQSASISEDDIPEDILPRIPARLIDRLGEQHRRLREFIDLDLKHKVMIKTAFHIAYDDDRLRKEVEEIFVLAEKRNVPIRRLTRDEKYNRTLVNQFLIDTISKSRSTSPQQFQDFWFDSRNCQFRRILCIVSYLHAHHLSFSLLNEEENEDMLDFTTKTISSNRFRHNSLGAILLSYLARQKEIQPHLEPALKNNGRMLELIPICGLERVHLFHETVFISREYCSIEFLTGYIDMTKLLDYIETNLGKLLNKSNTRTAMFDFLCTHSSDIPSQRKHEFKTKVIEFMKAGLGKEISAPDELFPALGISSSDFTVTEICKGIRCRKRTSDESFTLASNTLRRFEHSTDNADRNMAVRCLETLYNREKSRLKKKKLAERYILLKNDNATMNHYLARYYISTDSTISSWIESKIIAFGTLESLRDVCVLFKNSWKKPGDKFQTLQNIALSSFLRIRDNLIRNGSIQEIQYLLEEMNKLQKRFPSTLLQQAIIDTRLQYATAQHGIPSYEEIDYIASSTAS